MVTETRTRYSNPAKDIKKIVKLANIGFGMVVTSQAKVLSPWDEGQLRNSISVSSLTQTQGLNDTPSEKQAKKLDTKGLKGDEVFVGSNSDHAIFMEYGTKFGKRSIRKGQIRIHERPFLRPAMELQKGKISSIFKKVSDAIMGAKNG